MSVLQTSGPRAELHGEGVRASGSCKQSNAHVGFLLESEAQQQPQLLAEPSHWGTSEHGARSY